MIPSFSIARLPAIEFGDGRLDRVPDPVVFVLDKRLRRFISARNLDHAREFGNSVDIGQLQGTLLDAWIDDLLERVVLYLERRVAKPRDQLARGVEHESARRRA